MCSGQAMEVSWEISEMDPSWAMQRIFFWKFLDGPWLCDLEWPVVGKWNGKRHGA